MQKKHFLLLNGWGREKGYWASFPYYLKHSFHPNQEIQVTCLDLPGIGDERCHPAYFSLHKTMRFLRKQWLAKLHHEQEQGQKGKTKGRTKGKRSEKSEKILLGLSLGGMIGLEWGANFPEDFDSLIMVNSSVAKLNPFYHRLQPKIYKNLLSLLKVKCKREREYIKAKTVLNLRAKDAKLLDIWISLAEKRPIPLPTVIKQLLAAIFFFPPHPKLIPAKKLFLASEQDKLVHVLCSKMLAEYYESSLVIHSKAGHDLTCDDPQWVAQQVGLWLNDSAPSLSTQSPWTYPIQPAQEETFELTTTSI